ncbi:seroin-like isoform X1 [Danaus plexippus]|uniref:seroin-like isoform X1 n=2 Tax=Danaus plexippus TaxID=13037 RepID=UPI002AB25D8F|nr:seroin-like isoform X1 [Danaus plexippus]XP_061385892.1 seroin-like isoform X1 [Danaus plexippus]
MMGNTLFFMIAFIAASTNANFAWSSAGSREDHKFPIFPTFPTFPHFPKLNFPPFPSFPPFPTFPNLPSVVIPSKHDLINNDNPNFSGILVSSSSSSSLGPDGKVRKSGGTTVFTNDGGVVKEYSIGDNPPDLSVSKK